MRYANYKLTGVRKFPSIPAEWDVRRVKNFAVISHGSDPKTEGDIPVYGSGDSAFKSCGEFKVGPVVLIGRKGATLHIPHYVEGKYWNVDTAFDVRVVSGNDLRWFYYLAQCFDYALYVSQTTLPSMTQSNYNNMRVPYPPLATQRAIVAYLDEKCGKVDRLVAAKEKEAALLKELKQSMIAEAVTRGISHAESAECAEGVSSPRSLRSPRENNRRLVPSGIPWLPEVPEGWEVRRLASLFCDNAKQNKDFAYTRALKFNYGTLVPKNEVGEPEEYRDVYVKYTVLQENDIVINGLNLNYDFNSLRVACSPCDGIITSAYIVCRPRDGVESPYFTYLFKAMDYRKMFHGMGTGIRLTLSFNELRWQMLPIPPLAEQREIVAYIEARAAKIDAAVKGLEREVAVLKEYKQRLIADVVTGQRKVA